MSALLAVEHLSVTFGSQMGPIEAVRDVSFRVPRGGSVALVGESGSGKSVVSQTIMGILPPNGRITGGRILFADPLSAAEKGPADLAALDPNSRAYRGIRGGRISIVFQEPMVSLSPLHTIGDQVSEALLLHRRTDRGSARDLTVEMLRLVGFADPRLAFDTYPFELSGGLRQRVMIAMALVCHPALLIADEPTTALDVTIQAQILKLIRDLQAELGMALLLITHDLGVVANTAERLVVMYRGRVVESGPVRRLFTAPEHPYLKALLEAVPRLDMPRGERLKPIREIPPLAETRFLAQRPRPDYGSVKDPQTGCLPALLTVTGLRKSFRTRHGAAAKVVLAGVDLAIGRGECLGLVGESGCGKSTLSKTIMRVLTPDAGHVVFDDGSDAGDAHPPPGRKRGMGRVEVANLAGRDLFRYRKRVQYVFQDPFSALNPRMTVADILAEPLIVHGIGDAGERRARVAELAGLVGLDLKQLKRYPHSFSGGQRQRIGIARALALNPELLILDEPVSALDVSIQAQILNLLKDLQAQLGLTYLFVSHNLAVVDYIADRIAVMCAGRIVELAPREALFRRPVHPYTQALLAAVPEPDLDRPLDFQALMDGRASLPEAWPAPFTRDESHEPVRQDLGGGHFVDAFAAIPDSPA